MRTVHFSLAAIFISFITPGRVGELAKAYFLSKYHNASLKKLVAGNLLDKVFDVYTLLGIAIAGLIVIKPFGENNIPVLILLLLVSAMPLIFLIKAVRGILSDVLGYIQKNIFKSDTWKHQINSFFFEIGCLLNRQIVFGFVITLFAYSFFFGSCYFLGLSLTIPLSILKITFFIACANILSFIPISVAGIGTREATLVYLFSQANLSSETAFAFSTLVFTFTYLIFGLIGFFCFFSLSSRLKSSFLKDLRGPRE
jgi:uncharacterized protein (TIRG00374 family)